jgi:biopolymer transport protein TolR
MITGINVTPLVDITLVLLIIFMVTAIYVVREAIQVELPRAASGGDSVGISLALVVDEKGKLFVDGEQLTSEQARGRVREALAKDKDARAIISADRRVPHGDVVSVIDLVKTEGIAKFAINIEKEAAGQPPAGAR